MISDESTSPGLPAAERCFGNARQGGQLAVCLFCADELLGEVVYKRQEKLGSAVYFSVPPYRQISQTIARRNAPGNGAADLRSAS